jgi:RNA polymerase sigma-70 factor (ECF subfamily)
VHETAFQLHEAVVRRAQDGDAAALEMLVRELAPYLGRICGAIALDDGDDALQEAMVIICRKVSGLRDPAALRGWARQIAVRVAVRMAQSKRAVATDPFDLERVPTMDTGSTAVEVRAVLAELAPEQRAVLVLRHLDGLSEAEMAHVLHVAPGTVKSRLHRASASFRARWTA